MILIENNRKNKKGSFNPSPIINRNGTVEYKRELTLFIFVLNQTKKPKFRR